MMNALACVQLTAQHLSNFKAAGKSEWSSCKYPQGSVKLLLAQLSIAAPRFLLLLRFSLSDLIRIFTRVSWSSIPPFPHCFLFHGMSRLFFSDFISWLSFMNSTATTGTIAPVKSLIALQVALPSGSLDQPQRVIIWGMWDEVQNWLLSISFTLMLGHSATHTSSHKERKGREEFLL